MGIFSGWEVCCKGFFMCKYVTWAEYLLDAEDFDQDHVQTKL